MALRGKIVNFIGTNVVEQRPETTGIGQIAKVQEEALVVFVEVGVDPIDPACIKAARTPLNAVDFVSFV